MKEIALTQGMVTLVDDEDYPLLSRWRWCASPRSNGYYAVTDVGKVRVYMHRFILGMAPQKQRYVDHVNRNTLDNQKENIRWATFAQNMCNRIVSPKKKSSTFKGVWWSNRDKRWIMQIVPPNAPGEPPNKKISRYFTDEIQAAKAYDDHARRWYGEFARPNFDLSGNRIVDPVQLPPCREGLILGQRLRTYQSLGCFRD